MAIWTLFFGNKHSSALVGMILFQRRIADLARAYRWQDGVLLLVLDKHQLVIDRADLSVAPEDWNIDPTLQAPTSARTSSCLQSRLQLPPLVPLPPLRLSTCPPVQPIQLWPQTTRRWSVTDTTHQEIITRNNTDASMSVPIAAATMHQPTARQKKNRNYPKDPWPSWCYPLAFECSNLSPLPRLNTGPSFRLFDASQLLLLDFPSPFRFLA
jgi:hypothetical protein